MRLSLERFAFLAVACGCFLTWHGFAQSVLEEPSWSWDISHIYKFDTDSTTPESESGSNAFGNPVAEVSVGSYSDGWQSPVVSSDGVVDAYGEVGSSGGAWDLGGGSSAAIRITVPIGDLAEEAGFTAYRVRLSVTATAYGKMVGMPGLAVERYGLQCPVYEEKMAFADPKLGEWTNCVWSASLVSVLENEVTLVVSADPNWGSIVDQIEIYAQVEVMDEVPRTGMGVPIAWYEDHGLIPGEGETWNDMDFGDADGDGALNWEEYYGGTDPNNSASRFRITRIEAATEDQPVILEWLGGKGGSSAPYIIECALDLNNPVWEAVGSRERDDDENGLYIWVGDDLPYLPWRFFRVSAPNDMVCPMYPDDN